MFIKMNYQEISVYALFAAALIYVGKKVYQEIIHKPSAKGCAGCKVRELR